MWNGTNIEVFEISVFPIPFRNKKPQKLRLNYTTTENDIQIELAVVHKRKTKTK